MAAAWDSKIKLAWLEIENIELKQETARLRTVVSKGWEISDYWKRRAEQLDAVCTRQNVQLTEQCWAIAQGNCMIETLEESLNTASIILDAKDRTKSKSKRRPNMSEEQKSSQASEAFSEIRRQQNMAVDKIQNELAKLEVASVPRTVDEALLPLLK